MPKDLDSINEDDDVAAERQRIHTDKKNTSGDVLRMIDLVKVNLNAERFVKNRFDLIRRFTGGGSESILRQ